ncbi:MAG: CpaF family protein [Lachnospiraceae bacterium]|nr:CpaF family protein [Agathobacter sp.]MDD6353628.1 CpaF family protein [Lachnospiraceae bacterium]MDY5861933.1 CpaF family protein [Agathobacter sp.]
MLDELGLRIRDVVLSEIDLSKELSDEEICDLIGMAVSKEAREIPMTLRQRADLERIIFNSLRKLDILQELVDDKDVTEIMVNGPNEIFYEKAGRIYEFNGHFSSEEKLEDVIQQIVGRHNRVVNQASPIVDTRLSDGSRVNIVLNPISIGGSAVSIRKFPEHPMSMEKLIDIESISPEAAGVLQILTQAKYNIFISGGTGSGKTTFLNALSQYIPDDERIITIEDSAELQLVGAKNIVRLETRNSNTDGVTPITIRDLIRTALRMRPDRIIVGECRGAEALDMLQAMNTGHDGSLSTGHANSPADAISRIEVMTLMGAEEMPLKAIRQQVASGIDIIVQLGRLRDKSRRVLEISEIDSFTDGEIMLNSLYHFEESGVDDDGRILGQLVKTGTLRHTQKLCAAGLKI